MPNAFLFISLTLALLGSALANAEVPQRIASLNLCTDQLLLMLVPRERIASVTDWAARPESSYMAAAAQGLPRNHGLAEAALPQQPDLILAGEYTDATMVHLLRRLGYRVETVPVPRNLEQARAHILRFGELVGAADKAQLLVEDMDRRLRRIDAAVAHAKKTELAAVYAPNGMTVGHGVVLAEIIERAGWRNLGSELNIRGYGALDLEQLLRAEPQLIVLDITAEDRGGSIAHSYLAHPALVAWANNVHTVAVPPRLSECVGPMTVDAIELLMAQHESGAAPHELGATQR